MTTPLKRVHPRSRSDPDDDGLIESAAKRPHLDDRWEDGAPLTRQEVTWGNGRAKVIAYRRDGKLHGTRVTYYSTGRVCTRQGYVLGYKHGLILSYHRNGTVSVRENFRHGRKHGIQETFHANGWHSSIVEYRYGRPTGEERVFCKRTGLCLAQKFFSKVQASTATGVDSSTDTGLITRWHCDGRVERHTYVRFDGVLQLNTAFTEKWAVDGSVLVGPTLYTHWHGRVDGWDKDGSPIDSLYYIENKLVTEAEHQVHHAHTTRTTSSLPQPLPRVPDTPPPVKPGRLACAADAMVKLPELRALPPPPSDALMSYYRLM